MDLEPAVPPDDAVLRATRNWLERAVIGLSLCPFAKGVHIKGQIRYFVSAAETSAALLADLQSELTLLAEADPELVDTTLIVVPRMLGRFLDYNDFLEVADARLNKLGFAGVLQIASFHPDYQFADGTASDPANCSNRSPYPLLHLLREASVARAVKAFPDAALIFEKNIATLRALGQDGYARALAGDDEQDSAHGVHESADDEPQAAFADEPKDFVHDRPKATEFGELGLSPALLQVTSELGFEKLTKIQAESIPPLLAGRDLVGQSMTGSGKTAAFALPLLERLELARRELQGIVLCPTRELAAQVAREFRKLGRNLHGLSVAVLAGGEAVREQSRLLERGIHVVVGTPGRVIDHLQRRTLRVHGVRTVVLDEADRMLDMGFQPDIEKILRALPSPRQTVCFSATFPPSIRELCAKHQKAALWVSAEAESHETPDIRELVVRCERSEKLATLSWVLANHPHESALVFANLKVDVAKIEDTLRSQGLSVASLHGDLEQRDRDRVMVKFRNGSTRVLVATDVAARGIDLESLDVVVNFDLPRQPEIYVHRIGRTGRAGKSGTAVAFCGQADAAELEAIERYTGRTLTPVQRERPTRKESVETAGAASERRSAPMVTLRLSGGRKDKLRAGDILGALTGEAGALAGDDIGKIEIHERFSFVAVRKGVSDKALESLSAGRIKGRRFRVDRVE